MILNKFISTNYERLKEIAYNISRKSNIHEDLLHDSIVSLLESGKTFESEQDAEYYLIRVMYLSVNSKTSPFYKKEIAWVKNRSDLNTLKLHEVEPSTSVRELNENLDILVTRLNKFERMVFEQYIFTDFDYSELSFHTGIPVDYLYITVKNCKTKLRNYVLRKK